MITRNVAQFIRDQDTARAARLNYRQQARWLQAKASECGSDPDDVKRARVIRYYAAIAAHAAHAEFFDPEPGR